MRGGLITVSDHAVKRYKQRIGKKNANRKRVIQTIRKDVIYHMKNPRHVRHSKELDMRGKPRFQYVTCDRYIAVLGQNTVVTLYNKEGHERVCAYDDFITLNPEDLSDREAQ